MMILPVFLLALISEIVALEITINAYYPQNVGSMYLRGNGLGLSWDKGQLMTSVSSQKWSLTLTYPSQNISNILEVKVLVQDNNWMVGKNEMIKLGSQSGSVDIYPFFGSQAGKYQYVRNFYSPQLQNYRDLVIYTPPSYFENTLKKNYPVLYMHDGQNLFNDSTAFGGVAWRCQDTVNRLVVEGQMDEIIIVGVDNTINRTYELTYSYDPTVGAGGNGNTYLNFIEQTIVPYISSTFRISTQKEQMGILGSSLGGLISCYAGWTRTTYTKIGCMSSSFWWNSEDFNYKIMANPAKNMKDTNYLDSGDSGPDNDDEYQTIRVRDHMTSLGWILNNNLFYYLDHGGMHNEKYWGARFWAPMISLFPASVTAPY